jgi:hypothetical protein
MAKMAASTNSSASWEAAAGAAVAADVSWPPLSLSPYNRTRCREICRHAEDLEVSGNSSNIDKATVVIVQMAALLVLGDLSACRHLWRRHRDIDNNNNNSNCIRTALEPWWSVAAAMLSNRYTAVWEGLQNLVASNHTTNTTNTNTASSSVLPSNVMLTYTTEIAQAYRHRLLKKVLMMNHQQQLTPVAAVVASLPDYYTTVFGFAQVQELQDYYQQQSLLMMQQQQQLQQQLQQQQQQQSSSSTTLTCFLEGQRRNP